LPLRRGWALCEDGGSSAKTAAVCGVPEPSASSGTETPEAAALRTTGPVVR
jgi:hypothetical protein